MPAQGRKTPAVPEILESVEVEMSPRGLDWPPAEPNGHVVMNPDGTSKNQALQITQATPRRPSLTGRTLMSMGRRPSYSAETNRRASQEKRRSSSQAQIQIKTQPGVDEKTPEPDKEPDQPESLGFFKMSKRKRYTLISLSVASFTSYLSMSVLAPFFPEEAEKKQSSSTITGFIFGTYAFVNFFMSPIWGRLQDRIGPRRMFLTGMFVASLSDAVFGFMYYVPDGAPFIGCCFLVRTVEALGASAFITSSFSLVISEFPNNIGSVVGALETFTGIGMIVGPALGGALFGIGGFGLPFWIIGSFNMFICLPLNAFFLPRELIKPEKDDEQTKSLSVLRLLREPAILLLCSATACAAAVWGFLDPTLQPHLKPFHLSSEVLGLLFLGSSLAYAIMTPVWGWLVDRIADSKVLVMIGIFTAAISMFIIGPSPVLPFGNILWVNVVCMVIVGGTNGLSLIPTFDQIMYYARNIGLEDNFATYGFVSGLYRSAYALGEFIGPTFAGFMVETLTFESASSVFGLLAFIISALIFAFCLVERREKKKKVSQELKNKFVIKFKRESFLDTGTSDKMQLKEDFNPHTDA